MDLKTNTKAFKKMYKQCVVFVLFRVFFLKGKFALQKVLIRHLLFLFLHIMEIL